MDKQLRSDLMVVALELRLTAHDPTFASARLTEHRLLEHADIVEDAVLRLESQTLNREVAALTALGRRAT